jgi:hypothetical protein
MRELYHFFTFSLPAFDAVGKGSAMTASGHSGSAGRNMHMPVASCRLRKLELAELAPKVESTEGRKGSKARLGAASR